MFRIHFVLIQIRISGCVVLVPLNYGSEFLKFRWEYKTLPTIKYIRKLTALGRTLSWKKAHHSLRRKSRSMSRWLLTLFAMEKASKLTLNPICSGKGVKVTVNPIYYGKSVKVTFNPICYGKSVKVTFTPICYWRNINVDLNPICYGRNVKVTINPNCCKRNVRLTFNPIS